MGGDATVPPGRNVPLACLWMVGTLVSFSAAAVGVRLLANRLSIFEMLALRNIAGIVLLVLAAGLYAPFRAQFAPVRFKLHLLRSAFHFVGQAGWAWGLTILPFATVFALELTTPVWLALLAIPCLGEALTRPRLGAVILGLVGTVVILRPGLEAFQPVALVVIVAAIGFAATGICTKILTRTVPTFTILLWMNLIQFVMYYAVSDPLFPLKLGTADLPGAAMISLGGLLSHLCLTQALRYADAVLVTPLDFLRVPMIAFVGFFFFAEALDPWVFVGVAIVVAGIAWNLSAEARRPRPVPGA